MGEDAEGWGAVPDTEKPRLLGDVEGWKRFTLEKPYLLLVEGQDDEGFFMGLLKHLQVTFVQTQNIVGKHNLKPTLQHVQDVRADPSVVANLVSLGVVVDADKDPQATFQSVCGALRATGFTVPSRPLEVVGQAPSVCVMIMPGEGRPGALEDL